MHQNVVGQGSAPELGGGAYNPSQTSSGLGS